MFPNSTIKKWRNGGVGLAEKCSVYFYSVRPTLQFGLKQLHKLCKIKINPI